MGPNGHEAVCRAVAHVELGVEVTPLPQNGEGLEFITVYTGSGIDPASVLSAISKARLLFKPEIPRDGFGDKPLLELSASIPGKHTFRDVNFPVSS
jgi:hypothetical protein